MNDDDDDAMPDALTTRQLLVALEEMPPLTGYSTLVSERGDGDHDFCTVLRLEADFACSYAMLVSSIEGTKGIGRCFPDRDTFVMTIGSTPMVVASGAWLRGPNRDAVRFARDIRLAEEALVGTPLDAADGFVLLIDYETLQIAVVKGIGGAARAVNDMYRVRRERHEKG